MELKLLFVSAVLGAMCYSSAQTEGNECIKANAESCSACIQVGAKCGWCTDPGFLKYPIATRCDEVTSLMEKGCSMSMIENPRGSLLIHKNIALTDHKKGWNKYDSITQIQPQEIALHLRSGETQTFTLNFKMAEDHPIDLYYIMDVSDSTKDLENAKNIGISLLMEMSKITSDFRIGFGFVEKKVMPDISTTPDKLQNPCTGDQNCLSSFSFKNVLKLTRNLEQLSTLLGRQQISGNQNSSGGGLGALMQAAVCEDHPSVAQLVEKLRDNNLQVIFAVPEELQPAYDKLKNLIPKSAVGALSANSSNVINLISDAYNSRLSAVILENTKLPKGVDITYQSYCKNGVVSDGDDGRKCFNISIGDEVSFNINITANRCPEQCKRQTVKIRPLGLSEEVKIKLNFICDCECQKEAVVNSGICNSSGNLECGICRCNEGHIGQKCECLLDEVFSENLEDSCRKDGSSDICSNNGDCVCGTCECKKRDNPLEYYSGRYCECDNFNCDRANNKLCAGHGLCECRVCTCNSGYTGSACDCSLDISTCLASNNQVCNGRGICECGACKCTDPKFQGPTCEICPTCPGVCAKHEACVLCRAFGKGPKKDTCEQECNYFTLIKVKDKINLPQPFDDFPVSHCKMRDAEDCWFYYTYAVKNHIEIHAAEKLECPAP